MANCPQDLPWWRVVAKSGRLPIGKRDPVLGLLQEEILRNEGVEVRDGTVNMNAFEIPFV